MSKAYYVNKIAQSNGDHEVHVQGCTYLPAEQNRKFLGYYTSCQPAVAEAKKEYKTANGCRFCCEPCHTR